MADGLVSRAFEAMSEQSTDKLPPEDVRELASSCDDLATHGWQLTC
jgi:hypothetical protein